MEFVFILTGGPNCHSVSNLNEGTSWAKSEGVITLANLAISVLAKGPTGAPSMPFH